MASKQRFPGLAKVAAHLVCLLIVLAAWPAGAQTVTYVHTDALGSVVAKTDANGNVVERYDYEPYGAPVGAAVADGPAYTGHVSDSATGLSYMQQRYMDPELGVFLSVDPVTAYQKPVEQFNRYRYANGNPYRFTDPDGRSASALAPLVMVPIVVVTYYATTTPESRKQMGDAIVKGLLQKSEEGGSEGASPSDADPNGPFTNDVKTRKSPGGDGASSQHELERDPQGRLVSTTHTVTSKEGEVVHSHTDHKGENGGVRRFSDELTGKSTIGEGRQEPGSKDRPGQFPPEPVKGGRY
ncbi:RHS repeat domain-containing protein [Stenotrophomonas sp. AB1(2024)]|uniref:RHS repeat domain-containing protein n=1 Tax=Stenotrophomonas sp. AB1(2024) TaxID=3132215 RepID=UPI0030A242AD